MAAHMPLQPLGNVAHAHPGSSPGASSVLQDSTPDDVDDGPAPLELTPAEVLEDASEVPEVAAVVEVAVELAAISEVAAASEEAVVVADEDGESPELAAAGHICMEEEELTAMGTHPVLPIPVLVLPGAHMVQAWLPSRAANVPGAQGVHAGLPSAAENWPAGHGLQSSPLAALPAEQSS